MCTELRLPPMVSEAKDQLIDLFTTSNRKLWCVSWPREAPTKPEPSSLAPPSSGKSSASPSSGKSYSVFLSDENPESVELISSVIQYIEDGVQRVFSGGSSAYPHLHNASFWSKVLKSLFLELSPGLLSRNPRTLREKSETEIRHELLTPLLRHINHSMSQIVVPGCDGGEVFSSIMNYEAQTEERAKIPGAKRRVDYMLSGQLDGKTIYRVLVEAKKKMDGTHMSQLAHYLGTSARGLETSVGMGYLIDEYFVRLAFAPLIMGDTPLPIVFYTPALTWRDTQDGTTINRGVCVALCLLQRFPKERYNVTEESLQKCFKEWKAIKEAAEAANTAPPVPFEEMVTCDIVEEFELMKEKIRELEHRVQQCEDIGTPRRKAARYSEVHENRII